MPDHVIFLAFANDTNEPLAQLVKEEVSIKALLHDRHFRQKHFHVHIDSHTTHDSLWESLNNFNNAVWLFHYAGHADSKRLILNSGIAQADGIAEKLAQQSSLRLVFLNGCSTKAQVTKLLRLGIPAVIATNVPVNDTLAQEFAKEFYHSLAMRSTIQQAFSSAASYIQAKGKPTPILRSIFLDSEDEILDDNAWGLFYHPDKEKVLNERLPSRPSRRVTKSFEPNKAFIEDIFQAFCKAGVAVDIPSWKPKDKRREILRLLPAPIAEHLRKLFAGSNMNDRSGESYHELGKKRLRQFVRVYQILMELLTFTLLAQLWEEQLKNPFHIPKDLYEEIIGFLKLDAQQRETFFFIPFIRKLRLSIDGFNKRSLKITEGQNDHPYFVEELAQMVELIAEDGLFRQACSYLDFLRQRLGEPNYEMMDLEAKHLCIEVEQHLTIIFKELSFLARYDLFTVKQIQVQKYRHESARFKHLMVHLADQVSGLEEENRILNNFLDSQSVLLLKKGENNEITSFLNLSPFIIDENAFEKGSDLPKIYFLHHYNPLDEEWVYRWVHSTNDNRLSDESSLLVLGEDFEVFEEQLEVFKNDLKTT